MYFIYSIHKRFEHLMFYIYGMLYAVVGVFYIYRVYFEYGRCVCI